MSEAGATPASAARPSLGALPLALSRADLDRDAGARASGAEVLAADPRAVVLVLHEGRALGAEGPRLRLVPAASVIAPDDVAVYLGRTRRARDGVDAGTPILSVVVDDERAAALDGEWIDIRREGARLDGRDAGLFVQALALANWHASFGFSPHTGAPTTVAESGWVRVEPESGRQIFPRIDPAVIVAIVDDDDRLLLGSNIEWEPERFSTLAGFVEPGESLEATIVREIFEESGILVSDPEYRGSQPWPFPASLMIGFRARVAPGASTEPVADGAELRELRWFTRDELASGVAEGRVRLPGPASIARALIEEWFGSEIDDGSRS